MTRKSATTDTSTSTAIAPASTGAIAAYNEFADMESLLTDGDDGLGELDASDRRVSSLAINSKRVGSNGRQVPADEWYNNLLETSHREVRATFLVLHKTNSYTEFDQGEQKTKVVCVSDDRVTGTMADGSRRPCEGCPDAQWRTNADGKRTKACSVVFHVFGVDNDSLELFVTRFRRTSLPVIQQHLRKHHIDRMLTKRGRANVPLYAFPIRMTAAMAQPKPTHALPILERIVNPQRGPNEPPFIRNAPAFIEQCKQTVDGLKEQIAGIARRVDDHGSEADDSAGGDTTFDTSSFGGGEGKDFVTEAT